MINSFLEEKLRVRPPFYLTFFDKPTNQFLLRGWGAAAGAIFTEWYNTEDEFIARFKELHKDYKDRYKLVVHDADNKFVEEYDCT
jgi:hypothetical protein